jgi:hypothetical protein
MGPRTGLDAMERRKIVPLPGIQPQTSSVTTMSNPNVVYFISLWSYCGETATRTVQKIMPSI